MKSIDFYDQKVKSSKHFNKKRLTSLLEYNTIIYNIIMYNTIQEYKCVQSPSLLAIRIYPLSYFRINKVYYR
jgi:hypothetical protein